LTTEKGSKVRTLYVVKKSLTKREPVNKKIQRKVIAYLIQLHCLPPGSNFLTWGHTHTQKVTPHTMSIRFPVLLRLGMHPNA
jgi:hypothetical protein